MMPTPTAACLMTTPISTHAIYAVTRKNDRPRDRHTEGDGDRDGDRDRDRHRH